MTHIYDVAIVGAGPTGLTLASLLVGRDVRVAVVDPNRIVCQHPRATHIDDETMRMLQTLGMGESERDFLRFEGAVIMGSDHQAFVHHHLPQHLSDQGWRTDYMFHQPDFESRLRGLLATSPYADLYFGWQVTDVVDDGDGAKVMLRDRATQNDLELAARYVVGSDGAGSLLRQVMAAEVEDLHGTQRSLIIDIHPLDGHPPELPVDTAFMMCRDDNPLTYVPIFPPMLRFEYMLRDSDSAEELERPATVYKLLSEWLVPGSYRILRTDVYEWHAYLVNGWRAGRLILAGDAAHEMPPMLGQGVCSGIRDAGNLAWKLDAVLAGAPESLLDTYESERGPHVRPYIAESARQANIVESFNDPSNRPPGFIEQTVEQLRPRLGPGVSEQEDGVVGLLAPQPRTASGERLDDVTGYNFTVIGSPHTIGLVSDEVREIWTRLHVAVIPEPGILGGTSLDREDCDVVTVRPDRYVYAATFGPEDLTEATIALGSRVLATKVAM